MIPKIFIRTIPESSSGEVEEWWQQFQTMHPTWDFVTHREPLNAACWPITGYLFDRCQNGAQKAGLVRMEALYSTGGIYVDSDVRPVRPFDCLTGLKAFAGWEDNICVPDAVIGAEPYHPAIEEALAAACEKIEQGYGAWDSGPGVTTSIFPNRDDLLVLPPGAFYPHHYLEQRMAGKRNSSPWVFCEHMWRGSWLSEDGKNDILNRQRKSILKDRL